LRKPRRKSEKPGRTLCSKGTGKIVSGNFQGNCQLSRELCYKAKAICGRLQKDL